MGQHCMRHLLIKLTRLPLPICAAFMVLSCVLTGVAVAGDQPVPGSASVADVTDPGHQVCAAALRSPLTWPFSRVGKPALGVPDGDASGISSSYSFSGYGGSGTGKSEEQEATTVSRRKRKIRVGGGYFWLKPEYRRVNIAQQDFAFSQSEYQSNSGAGFADFSLGLDVYYDDSDGFLVAVLLRTLYRSETAKDGDTDINMDWLSVRLGVGGSYPLDLAGLLSETGLRFAIYPVGINRIKVTGLPIKNSIYRWWWRDRDISHSKDTTTQYAPCADLGWYLVFMDRMDLHAYAVGDVDGWGVGMSLSFVLPSFLGE